MEHNEISMFLDVKLDIHDKRPESLKFKAWTRCEAKVEAIKCLPCFLRINFVTQDETSAVFNGHYSKESSSNRNSLSVSINVPGVSISLAESRTKQHSYGLFWTQSRRACYIYFALETEASCRRHMKWIKKSIKNLELYRQVFLEQRRNSRGPWRFGGIEATKGVAAQQQVAAIKGGTNDSDEVKETTRELSSIKATLGPLPQIPHFADSNNSNSWSRCVSRASDIYEEIFEGTPPQLQHSNEPLRLSRRYSRTSIASGIYEEMKPTNLSSANNFNAIVEELTSELGAAPQPPPLPPLPPPRKRINTYDTERLGLLGEIPRSNTNPESELAKKKKSRNVLENIFGSGRSKRAATVSEPHVSSVEELIECNGHKETSPIYANEVQEAKPLPSQISNIVKSKRNSFSSPDLSKINFLDTFDEDKIADILLNSFLSHDDDLDSSSENINNYANLHFQHFKDAESVISQVHTNHRRFKADSLESLNFSQQLPSNFNFSALNSSTMNLLGASGAVPLPTTSLKNKILIDDLTGYCVMAPIVKKTTAESNGSSGYSTGSHCSSTSSCNTNLQEDPVNPATTSTTKTTEVELRKPKPKPAVISTVSAIVAEESVIYENMHGSNNTSRSTIGACCTPPQATTDFTGNLYENLLAVKAAQELGDNAAPISSTLSTSTPTDSPHALASSPAIVLTAGETEEEESFYQTPRKSIISVDDKIPSYYPNSCDNGKMRRQSPAQQITPNSTNEKSTPSSIGLRHLVNMKIRRDRKENLYISSPQKIIEQRQNPVASSSASSNSAPAQKLKKSSTQKSKKTAAAAHKISDNVYAVTHANKKNGKNNNNQAEGGFTDVMKEKLQTELLQLAMLQNIDFKFDDAKTAGAHEILPTEKNTETPPSSKRTAVPVSNDDDDEAYENRYQASVGATRLLHKYAANMVPPQTSQHHLQLNQAANTKSSATNVSPTTTTTTMTQSTASGDAVNNGDLQLSGMRKFASLPRFKKIDFSPLKLKINNVLQRNQPPDF